MALIFLSGPITNTERTVALSAAVRPSEVVPAVFRQHVVGLGHLELGVADHRVVQGVALGLLDVLRPLLVVAHGVDAQAEDLGVALVELGLERRHVAELGGADRA